MDTEIKPIEEAPVVETPEVVAAIPADKPRFDNRGGDKRGRRSPRRDTRVKPEFDQKIVNIRRVVRVMGGGRRFTFSVALVAGNRKGMVGVGQGKAGGTSLATDKA